MDPLHRSANSFTSSASSSDPIEIYTPKSFASVGGTEDSPSLTSLKSVDSVPVTGVYPFGSLRLNEHRIEPDLNMDLATPLTVPDRTPERFRDQETELVTGGDVLILDDLPANFTVGCDTISFSTTQQFPGFREIPPGAHLIWVAPSESNSTRSAYWIVTPERDTSAAGIVYVKQWDKFNEVLSEPASLAEERFQRERLAQIYPNLAPYQYRASTSAWSPPRGQPGQSDHSPSFLSNTTIWYQLTFAITPELLNRLTGGTKNTWPVTTSDRIVGETSLPEEVSLYPSSAAQLKFTFPMDQRLFDTKASGSERTQQSLDPTAWVLSEIADNEDVLLGELQFAFLTGMHLGNYSCLEQWWYYTTRIIFRSYRLAVERPGLVRHLIQVFHAQLAYDERYLEGSVLADPVAPGGARRLQRALTVYKSRLNEQLLALGDRCTDEQGAVGAAFASLESWVWRLGWDLRGEYVRSGTVMLEDGELVHAEVSDFEDEDERGEFAAVVVDLDENGRPTDFVTV